MPPEIAILYRHFDKGDEKKQKKENYRQQPSYILEIAPSHTSDNQLVLGHLRIITKSQYAKEKTTFS